MANITQMIADLDQQIGSLQAARQALAEAHGIGAALPVAPRGNFKTALKQVMGGGVKRTMSPDARRRIAEAQKKRWAAVNKTKGGASRKVATAKKVVAKKVAAAPRRPKAKKEPPMLKTTVPPTQESTPAEEVVS